MRNLKRSDLLEAGKKRVWRKDMKQDCIASSFECLDCFAYILVHIVKGLVCQKGVIYTGDMKGKKWDKIYTMGLEGWESWVEGNI